MRYLFLLLFVTLTSVAQIDKESLNLMPWPQKIETTTGVFKLTPSFQVNITGAPNRRILRAASNFLRRLDGRTGMFFKQGFASSINEFPQAQLQINCVREGIVDLNENESYQLTIQSNTISINASTDLGAMYALETLLQLLQNDATSYFFPNLSITDKPRFTWRGLMIDAARRFQPIDVIKRNLDAMAAVKMNVFHWHLVDDQGWRIEMKKHKILTDKASEGFFYTQEEIKDIVKYADDRGILVVPEIDVPGHATSILTAFPEIASKSMTYSLERNAGVFNPTLDPTNPKTYKILGEIFDEVCPLFPSKYFHIGGDENEGKHWDSNPKIQEFMKKNKIANNHELQTYFNVRLIPMLRKHKKELMGWEEIMTKEMTTNAIIHSWKGVNEGVVPGISLIEAAKKGHKVVLSNGFYVDLVEGVETHYMNDYFPVGTLLSIEEQNRILGGESTMWTELATAQTVDSRIWPKTAAIAERLWSDASVKDLANMRKRLKVVSFRLEELGITHIKNKDVFLRNIGNNQDIAPLQVFSAICEPLKIYSRNAGGTEYQMYSPLTLFADACTPDAEDALSFNEAVNNYLKNKSSANQILVTNYLKKWIDTHSKLIVLSTNAPLVQPILPLSKSLSDLSEQLLLKIEKQQTLNPSLMNDLLEKCSSKNHADVELAVYNSLKKLISAE